jgi:rubredoxin
MFQSYNDGECPQCALDHRRVEMRLNQDDHWECPECRLQMVGSGGQVMLLRERGGGDFKQPDGVRYRLCRRGLHDPAECR